MSSWARPARDERHEALEELTTAMRRLIDATVSTGHAAPELQAISAEVDALADRLGSVQDHDPWFARSYGPGVFDFPSLMGINPAIGRCNPVAPIVELLAGEDGTVAGTVRFDLAHVGPPGRANGGIIASVFDQLLGAATMAAGVPGFTGSLTVRYRRPTPLGVDLRMEASCTSAEGGRRSRATGVIFDEDGEVAAEAEGLFIVAREAG